VNSGSITIAPFTWAKRRKRDFDRIIGCYDPDTWQGKIIQFHRPDPPDLLVLKFVDLDEPAPPPHDTRQELHLPTRDDVQAALDFDRPNEKLLIHCHAGISRSTALALAILAARMGTGTEKDAVEELIRIRAEAVPNFEIVRLADLILERQGRLIEAVLERETPRSQERRRLNRQAYLTFYGCG
jgi:predicted protein tyrosine phosphatase